jgi:hypothetical protein
VSLSLGPVRPSHTIALLTVSIVALGFVAWRGCASEAEPEASAPGTTARTTPSLTPGTVAPSTATTTAEQAQAVLACLRENESRNEYGVVSASGEFFGAYQFDQQTWNATAQQSGQTSLVGVQPNEATPADQDAMALALLQWQGTWPWDGDPCVS